MDPTLPQWKRRFARYYCVSTTVIAVTLLVSCVKAPIKVGVAMVLTGLNSEIGVTGRNGAELAAERINAAGGVRGRYIELIVKDDKGESDTAEQIDAKLVEEGVVAIIGHMSSSSGLKAIPAAMTHELPLISPTISSSLYSQKDDYFFRVIGENSLQGKALAAYAYDGLGLRRVAAAYEWINRAYTAEVFSSFREEFEHRGGEVADAVTFTTSIGFDYGPTLVRLLAFKPDGLLSVAGPADNATLCALLEKRGSTLPVLAGMWSMTQDLIQLGGRSADRMIVAGTMDPASDTGAFRDFDQAYRERYGAPPTFSAVHSYEAVRLLASALEKNPSWRGEDLKKAILALGRIEGIQDDFSFDRFGDADRPYKVFRVIDGRFTRVR